MEIERRRKRDERGKWNKTPEEYYSLNSFDELQEIYDKLGFDFLVPVRNVWTYNCDEDTFINSVEKLNVSKENRTELELSLIKEVEQYAQILKTIKRGNAVIFQE